MRRLIVTTLLGLLCLCGFSGDTEAGLFRRSARQRLVVRYSARVPAEGVKGCLGTSCPGIVYPAPQAVYPAPQTPAGWAPGDFLGWLNATRAEHGLAPVGLDPNLTEWAARNNAAQQARGLGHYVMGPARRQNSAMGGYGSLAAMWMGSSAHRSALLDPSIRVIGLAGSGGYWTFNAS